MYCLTIVSTHPLYGMQKYMYTCCSQISLYFCLFTSHIIDQHFDMFGNGSKIPYDEKRPQLMTKFETAL